MTKVVIVGGGLSGALIAKLLENDADVTLVDSKEYFEVRWAILRAMVEPSITEQILFPHKAYLKKATLVVGTASNVSDKEVTLADGTVLPYDYLVIATGSPAESSFITLDSRKAFFRDQASKLKAAKKVLIVGGGPVGVELAGEIVTDHPGTEVTIVHSGSRLMEFAGEKAAAKALKWLQSKNVTVLFNDRVEDASWDKMGSSGTFKTQSGKEISTDYLALAIGGHANAAWLQEGFGSAVEKSTVKVDSSFRVEGHTNVFAIGDITNIKEAKQGYLAQIHARTTAANIKALIKGEGKAKSLKTYGQQPEICMISLGRKNGVAQMPFGTFTGWMPTNIKSKKLFIPNVRKELGLTA